MKQTLCQNCGTKPATIFYRETKNGVRREWQLCPDCASKMGIVDFQENLFSFPLFSHHATEQKKAAACPLCGTTLAEIRSRGKFGCSGCYDTFADHLDLTPFVGKGYPGKKEETYAESSAPASPQDHETDSELSKWKDALKKAIAAEDYESAAVLRDKIRAKEGK